MPEPAHVQVSDIYKFNDTFAINIDFQRQEYRVCWRGSWRDVPDLTSFSPTPGSTVTHIPHSPEVAEVWARSHAVRYGADSHIRLLDQHHNGYEGPPIARDGVDDEKFPVCKLAGDDRQRRFIVDEFEILRDLGAKGAPVVRVHPEPLVDGEGMFGFRMEKLTAIGPDAVIDKGELTKCLEQIHHKGVVHNDFHSSNVMLNSEGRLVVIDFGRSGHVGTDIPRDKRPPWSRAEVYSFEAGRISIDKFF
jgi:hypothetical protein